MQSICTCDADTLRAKLKELEEQAKRDAEELRKREALEQASNVDWQFKISTPHGGSFCDVWYDTEIFVIRPYFTKPMDKVLSYGHGSVGYLVSRREKRVIGYVGGGQCYLSNPLNKHERKLNGAYSVLIAKLESALAEFLSALP